MVFEVGSEIDMKNDFFCRFIVDFEDPKVKPQYEKIKDKPIFILIESDYI